VRYGERFEDRPPLGDGRRVEVGDVDRAVRLSDDVTLVLAGALAVVRR
jgi:cobalamin biosynthesis protein CobD/CbiB